MDVAIASIPYALRLLGHFWLEEVKGEKIETIAALPELAETLPELDEAALTELAVEYQRLFGFNLPPYESLFIDPSAMLMAPAAQWVQDLYRQGGWQPPAGTRVGAPDHLGLELLALADWWVGKPVLARQLLTRHLALWAPAFMLTLRRLNPHPFYLRLGDLTLSLILATLPEIAIANPADLFPALPQPSIYKGSEEPPAGLEPEDEAAVAESFEPPDNEAESPRLSLRGLVRRLLSPREIGIYFTREDLARVGYKLALPGVMGERFRMLENLFEQAIQYDLLAALFEQFIQVLEETKRAYGSLAGDYPAWKLYAEAWRNRVEAAQAICGELKTIRRAADLRQHV
jgi:TorA maturation chaperone TorD